MTITLDAAIAKIYSDATPLQRGHLINVLETMEKCGGPGGTMGPCPAGGTGASGGKPANGGASGSGGSLRVAPGKKISDNDAKALVKDAAAVMEKAKLSPYIFPHYSDSQLSGLNTGSSNTQNWTVQDGDNPPKHLKIDTKPGAYSIGVAVNGKQVGIRFNSIPSRDGEERLRIDQGSADAVGIRIKTAFMKEGIPREHINVVQTGYDAGWGTQNVNYAVHIKKH